MNVNSPLTDRASLVEQENTTLIKNLCLKVLWSLKLHKPKLVHNAMHRLGMREADNLLNVNRKWPTHRITGIIGIR